jgi:Ribbon-helix-helix domain
MGKTNRKLVGVYVDHDKYALLSEYSNATGIPRAVLWREALEDLLVKRKLLKKGGPKGGLPTRRP